LKCYIAKEAENVQRSTPNI